MPSPIPDLDTLKSAFTFLTDMEDKFAYLIELGGKLPEFPKELQDKAHSVPGCLSQVWMDYAWDSNGHLSMRLMSDAVIVKGLLAILMAIYDGQGPEAIIAADPKAVFAELGLEGQMTSNRRSGFVAVASRIRNLAQARLGLSPA